MIRGFTLIEILIVITIIAILLAGLVTGILWVVEHSREVKTKAILEALMAGLKSYAERQRGYPPGYPVEVKDNYNLYEAFFLDDGSPRPIPEIIAVVPDSQSPTGYTLITRKPEEPINLEIKQDCLGEDPSIGSGTWILDAWGRAIRYYYQPDQNVIGLISLGSNGKGPESDGLGDDIVKTMFIYAQ